MELAELTEGLSRMSGDELRAVAAALTDGRRSVGDEVDSWRIVVHVDSVLRKTHRARLAAHAAYAASQAVLAAAQASAVVLPDPDVTRVARAAALLARGIVAGDEAAPDVRFLLHGWAPLFVSAS